VIMKRINAIIHTLAVGGVPYRNEITSAKSTISTPPESFIHRYNFIFAGDTHVIGMVHSDRTTIANKIQYGLKGAAFCNRST
jgi:hypothetical protein